MAKRKYPTLTSLVRAFKSGELNDYIVRVDKDVSWLEYCGAGCRDMIEAKNDECADWYRGSGKEDLMALYEELGIVADWC